MGLMTTIKNAKLVYNDGEKTYLVLGEIHDERLTPNLNRVRSGPIQSFKDKDENWKVRRSVFKLTPPSQEYFANIHEGKWYWMNGCDKCNGRTESYPYIRCVKHDVCIDCGIPRDDMKDVPWGVPGGIRCKPCGEILHNKEKAKALSLMGEYDEENYRGLDIPTCPHCNLELDYSDFYEAQKEEIVCYRCDNTYTITAEHITTFTMEKK